jgi:hypothetical protein
MLMELWQVLPNITWIKVENIYTLANTAILKETFGGLSRLSLE